MTVEVIREIGQALFWIIMAVSCLVINWRVFK